MSVNAEQSARRLKSLYDHWKVRAACAVAPRVNFQVVDDATCARGAVISQANPEAWGNAASFIVANGPANKSEDEISYRKPTAFQMRLFEYELPGESWHNCSARLAAKTEASFLSQIQSCS